MLANISFLFPTLLKSPTYKTKRWMWWWVFLFCFIYIYIYSTANTPTWLVPAINGDDPLFGFPFRPRNQSISTTDCKFRYSNVKVWACECVCMCRVHSWYDDQSQTITTFSDSSSTIAANPSIYAIWMWLKGMRGTRDREEVKSTWHTYMLRMAGSCRFVICGRVSPSPPPRLPHSHDGVVKLLLNAF